MKIFSIKFLIAQNIDCGCTLERKLQSDVVIWSASACPKTQDSLQPNLVAGSHVMRKLEICLHHQKTKIPVGNFKDHFSCVVDHFIIHFHEISEFHHVWGDLSHVVTSFNQSDYNTKSCHLVMWGMWVMNE